VSNKRLIGTVEGEVAARTDGGRIWGLQQGGGGDPRNRHEADNKLEPQGEGDRWGSPQKDAAMSMCGGVLPEGLIWEQGSEKSLAQANVGGSAEETRRWAVEISTHE